MSLIDGPYENERHPSLYDYEEQERYEEFWQESTTQYLRSLAKTQATESFLQWEHELSQPDYYAYFLEEVTR